MESKVFDILVVGSGPAGLSAAVNGRVRNKSVAIVSGRKNSYKLEKAAVIENYLGFESTSGSDLADVFFRHAQNKGVEFFDGSLVGIYDMGEYWSALASDQNVYQAKTVILATGSVQKAAIDGEERLLGMGVSYCATCDGPLYRGKPVAVLGYNDKSVEEANYLSEVCSNVTFIVGSKNLNIESNSLRPEIRVVRDRVKAINGDDSVTAVALESEEIPVEAAFILRDSVPIDKLVDGLEMDNGHLKVERDMSTNLKGIFAAGDCTGGPYQIAKAVGEGLVAGLSAASYIDKQKNG